MMRYRIARWVVLWSIIAGFGPAAVRAQQQTDAATRQYAAAVALQNRGEYDLAADEWSKFINTHKTDPRLDRAFHYLGICYLKANKLPPALESFQTVVKTYPKFELLEATYFYLGVTQYTLAQSGKPEMYDAAAATFATLLEKYPEGKYAAQALFQRGDCLYNRGKKAEAVKLYAQLVEKFPEDKLLADAVYALGVTEEELGHAAEAGKQYDLFLEKFPKHPLVNEVTLRRAETLFAQGQFQPAADWFASAAARQGFAMADHAMIRQAAALAQLKKYNDAAAIYAAVATKFPKSRFLSAANLAGGKCYYLAGNFAEAGVLLGKAVVTGGEAAPEAAHWFAKCLLKEKKPAEALKIAESALPMAGTGPWAVQLAMDQADAAYDIPERRKDSVKLYADLAAKHAKDPLAPQALYMAGFAALGQGDHAAALKHANEFLASYPTTDLGPDVLYVAAEANLQLNQHPEAEKLFAELVEKYPKHADVEAWTVRRALAAFLQKKYQETLDALQPRLAQIKTPELLAEAQYLVGSSQAELKQFDAAAKSLEASLAAGPNWRQADDTRLVLAHAYQQLGKTDQAKDLVRKLIAGSPNSRVADRAHFRLGEYSTVTSDWKTAAAEYQQMLEKWPQSPLTPHALYGLGWAQLSLNDHAAAEKTFDKLIADFADHPLVPRAKYARGMARQQLKKLDAAMADVQALLAADPTPAEKSDARYVLGLCQVGLKKNAEAVATFQALLKDDPNYASADKVLYETAWALKSDNKEKEAAEAFAALTAKHPASPLAPEAYYHAGEAAYKAGDFKKAAQAYFAGSQKAGVTDLGEKITHKLGWAYYRQEDFVNAQGTFAYQRTTWPAGPLAADAAFMEGECLFKQNKFAEALAAYKAVKNPSGKDFTVLAALHSAQAIVQIKQEQPAEQAKQWQESLEILTKCLAQNADTPYGPELLCEQGWAQQNLGKMDEAAALYEQVIAKTGRETAARAQFLIGEVQFQQKKHADAIKSYFKVIYGFGFPKWQAEAEYEAARCFEVLGKKAQAIKQYQELIDKYPKSDKAPTARQRLTELK